MAFRRLPGHGETHKSPSTPNRIGKSSLFSQAPSTTPAGEPPIYLTNTNKSTTPAGRPPRSSKIFGSSYNPANNTFGHRTTPPRRGRAFAVPESSPAPIQDDDDDGDEMDADGEVLDEGYGTQTGNQAHDLTFMSSMGPKDSWRGLKRSRDGQVREQDASGMAAIATSFARDAGPARLNGEDSMILQTEDILATADARVQSQTLRARDETITTAAAILSRVWAQFADTKTVEGGVGPDSDDPITKANYLASLFLQLHNPHNASSSSPSAGPKSRHALVAAQQDNLSAIPIPKALINWLNAYHKPLGDDFDEVHMHRPSPSAHESFWDLVGGELLRGQFARVARLLKDAGFQNAITAQDDGSKRSGYEGRQLENVEEVVARFVRLLESCPIVRHDDWDIKGADWSVFRQRVRHAIKDLEAFAKGNDEDDDPPSHSGNNVFAQSGNPSLLNSMAAASTRAESRVPWSIYEHLRILYGFLLGREEAMDYAQDWLESTIFLTVWWDGEDAPASGMSVAGHDPLRISLAHAGGRAGTREVDLSPMTAYRRRLGKMFRTTTAQVEEFQPDTLDPVQVGLVCVIEDSVEAVINLLQSWDQTITAGVVEIAALGGWLPQARPSSRGLLQRGFSTEDLMVLSHGPGQQRPPSVEAVDRDELLTSYADLLAAKDAFRGSGGEVAREGWELAVSVLGRLDDTQAAQAKITDVLENMKLHDESRVDKVLELCTNLGLTQQARGIAERYADSLAENASGAYGAALIYYARAHCTQKLKATISFMISLCLLQSTANPSADKLDAQLASLLSTERRALVALADADIEAATLLSGQISGYATVRRFYELRDGTTGKPQSLESKRNATKALIAVTESASDCIRGGLFDPEVQSVVPVDGLLALLGEALPLLGQEKKIFTESHVLSLMRIVEDFDTAPARIREGAVELLQASMNAYRNGASQRLRRDESNVSSMSGSGLGGSSWDMVLSLQVVQGKDGGKAAEIPRAWDWRKGLDAVAGANVEGKEVLMLLRMALAQEVARGWGGAIGW